MKASTWIFILCITFIPQFIFGVESVITANPLPANRIVFGSFREAGFSSSIYSVRQDGTDERQLSIYDTGEPASLDPWPTFEGSVLLFSRGGGGHRSSVWRLDVKKHLESSLTGNVMVRFNNGRAWPSVRPGHQQYVYVKEEAGIRGLVLASLDSSSSRDLGPGEFPSWSPDGSQLAYQLAAGDGFRVWVMTLGEGRSRPITDSDWQMSYPAWSPTGEKILVSGRSDEGSDLFVIDLEGGASERVTSTPTVSEIAGSWSPDGRFVAFSARSSNSTDGWQHSIFVLDLETGESNEITSGRFHDSRPTWISVGAP